jgi:hypothetical protein
MLSKGALCAASVLLVDAKAGASVVVYSELFPNTTTGNAAFSSVGWQAHYDATAVIQSNGTAGGAVVSNVVGIDGNGGYGAKTATGTVGLHWTTEFGTIDRSVNDLSQVTFFLNNANGADLIRVAVRIDSANTPGNTADDTWHASSATFTHSGGAGTAPPTTTSFPLNGGLKTFTWTTDAADWRDLTFTSGSALSLGAVRASSLPSGAVTGAGLFNQSNAGVIRFDNFQISQVPEPTSLGAAAIAVGGLLARRRRVASR